MTIENHKLVMPEHLNQHGFLFGGYMLQWVDEYAWIAASTDHPACHFVTIGMDHVEFRKSVRGGTILKFVITKIQNGKTSVQYGVSVFDTKKSQEADGILFSTNVTFVNIDEKGNKKELAACCC